MPTIARIIAVTLALLLVLAAGVFLFIRSPASSDAIYPTATAVGLTAAPPERHVVPEGFRGWAVVHFAVEGAPQLREEEGVQIIEYPPSGRLDTSSPAPEAEGFLHRGYYRETPDGLMPLSRATEVWGEFSHSDFRAEMEPGAGRSTGFFIGTMTEFRATEWPVEHREPVGAEQ